jgi:hypothetical protein
MTGDVSQVAPTKIKYHPESGKYDIITFEVQAPRNVNYTFRSENYADFQLQFSTNTFFEKRNISLLRRTAAAEAAFDRARQDSARHRGDCDKYLDDYRQAEYAVNLNRTSRYLDLQAEIVAKCIDAAKSSALPSFVHDYIDRLKQPDALADLDPLAQSEIFMKVGNALARLLDEIGGAASQPYLVGGALAMFERAVDVNRLSAVPVQAKYQLEKASGRNLEALETIAGFFERNPSIRTETTLLGLLIDWVDSLEVATNYTGRQDIDSVRSDDFFRRYWVKFHNTAAAYRAFLARDLPGMQRVREAFRVSTLISRQV